MNARKKSLDPQKLQNLMKMLKLLAICNAFPCDAQMKQLEYFDRSTVMEQVLMSAIFSEVREIT